MDYSVCWHWVQSLDLSLVSSLNWSQPIEFLQNTLICDTPRYFRREWNQRSRENTDFAIVSKAKDRTYKQWSHCHKHVIQAMVKNYSRLGRGSEVELDLDSATVENLLRILYTRQYVSVNSITENHHLLMKFIQELSLIPDRLKVAQNYLRSEFHRFGLEQSFLKLSETQLEPYLNIETLPLHTVLDLNFIMRSFLHWAFLIKTGSHSTIPKDLPSCSVNSAAFAKIATTVCDLLTDLHGELTVSPIELAHYSAHVSEDSIDQFWFRQDSLEDGQMSSSIFDLLLVSSDNVTLRCKEGVLCRIPYFQSLLHGGFRESLQQGQVRLDMHSSMLSLVLEALESGTLPDLPVDKLLDSYTVFDYLQSDELLHAFDQQMRRIALRLTQNSLGDFLAELSPALMQRTLPLFLRDMTDTFGMKGYTFVLRFLLRWLEVDASRDDWLGPILSSTLTTVDGYEHAKKVVYESFDGLVHVFDGKTWAPCHWGDFDSIREGVYNFKVLGYKQRYLTHNFLRSNTVALQDCATSEETTLARHSEGRTGYFIEMLGKVFCSVDGEHFVIGDDLKLHEVDMPTVEGFALEPRCVDEAHRRIYFYTERVGFCVQLDSNFSVMHRWEFDSSSVTTDHQLHVIEGYVLALRLGHDALVLDVNLAKFVSVNDYIKSYRNLVKTYTTHDLTGDKPPGVERLVDAQLLPQISGVIYKIFKLQDQTFLIVTEAVELTQARLRISETESDPRLVGFFKWSSESRCWRDISAASCVPKAQIQQTVVLNHPGVPLYARRPCYD
ncbi:hypothetical protein BIW11_05256 [Tropilaelaps mercedesae]|uniref:BTB domain-containing protein n=1 Tax=Tropilaelaps mercedesae TaxID=418985 RepID=A0A1V9Y349_9ACAR|nr:hypothetical protein BIW11_05256 [Tropilaelaps mercedesae]